MKQLIEQRYPRWLPLAAAILALGGLNAGLYGLLAPATSETERTTTAYELPFVEVFDDPAASDTWEVLGGNWEIQDSTLIQLNPLGYDLGITLPISILVEQPYTYSARVQYLGGSMGGGIIFNLQQPTSRQRSHMVRFNVDGGSLYVIFGYFDEGSNFAGQGSVLLDSTPENSTPFTLGVQVSPSTYNVLLDGSVIAADIPLQSFGGGLGLISSGSQIAFDDVQADRWEPVAVVAEAIPTEVPALAPPPPIDSPTLAAGAMLAMDSFDEAPAGDSPWLFLSGDWVVEAGNLVQRPTTGYDHAAGYRDTFTRYRLQTTFRHLEGGGGGLLFNMPAQDSRLGAHMVRYFENGSVLAWGYFDNSGAFIGQGSASVSPAGTDTHTLEIRSGEATYSIILDGAQVVEGIPLTNTSGHIGLTASESAVTFESVAVYALEAPGQITTVGDLEFSMPTGNWTIADGVITQLEETATDFVAGTGISAERFTVSVTVLLPDRAQHPDAGGGIIFHMDSRDTPTNGIMARFGSGGSEIFWGNYDSQGVFNGQGGSPLDLQTGVPHKLTLVVRDTSFDILVDDQVIVTDLPQPQAGGWLGLVSFNGPVSFSDFQLSLGG